MRPMTLFHFVMPFGRKLGTLGLSLGMLVLLWMDAAGAVSRIKDIATFEGVRGNMLVGYGLMVGLNGTGDSLSNSPFTKQSLIGMLEGLGVNVRDDALKTDALGGREPYGNSKACAEFAVSAFCRSYFSDHGGSDRRGNGGKNLPGHGPWIGPLRERLFLNPRQIGAVGKSDRWLNLLEYQSVI